MSKKDRYPIKTAEEFVDEWIKQSPQLFSRAKELNIILENEDGTPMAPYMLFVTGQTTAGLMDQGGMDRKTKKQTLQLVATIKKFNDALRKKADPSVTEGQIKEFFEHRHTHEKLQKVIEAEWVTFASLAWYGYSHDGRGILYINDFPPKGAKFVRMMEGEPPIGPMKEMYQLVKTYDPAKEFIAAVLIPEPSQVYLFQLTQKPYPPEAYQKRKHVFKK
jgi:hypothetical protein